MTKCFLFSLNKHLHCGLRNASLSIRIQIESFVSELKYKFKIMKRRLNAYENGIH